MNAHIRSFEDLILLERALGLFARRGTEILEEVKAEKTRLMIQLNDCHIQSVNRDWPDPGLGPIGRNATSPMQEGFSGHGCLGDGFRIFFSRIIPFEQLLMDETGWARRFLASMIECLQRYLEIDLSGADDAEFDDPKQQFSTVHSKFADSTSTLCITHAPMPRSQWASFDQVGNWSCRLAACWSQLQDMWLKTRIGWLDSEVVHFESEIWGHWEDVVPAAVSALKELEEAVGQAPLMGRPFYGSGPIPVSRGYTVPINSQNHIGGLSEKTHGHRSPSGPGKQGGRNHE